MSGRLDTLRGQLTTLAAEVRNTTQTFFARLRDGQALETRRRQLWGQLSRNYRPEALGIDLEGLRLAWQEAENAWWPKNALGRSKVRKALAAMEVSNCIGVLPRALAASSLSEAERLLWALDAVLDDPFDLCDDLAGYLNQEHPKDAWDTVADTLLKRLATGKASKGDFDRDAQRDHLIEWVTRALERAGREQEIVPLCEAEAESPAGYARLVNRLIDLERYGEAEHWIRKGILATSKKYPGIASDLRDALLTIKTRQQDWAAVALLQVDGFVRRPSVRTFGDCKDAADRLDAWPAIRHILLEHLASGRIPWKEPEWPLPPPGNDAPKPERRDTFPRFSTLIEIAIHEKKPEEALRWYDRRPREHFFGYGPLDENVAAAVASQAPDRAIAIWKAMCNSRPSIRFSTATADSAAY